MATQKDFTYEAAYTAPTTEPVASWNAMVRTTSKAAPLGAPSRDTIASVNAPNPHYAASSTTPRANTENMAASLIASSSYLPTLSTDDISVGLLEPTWSLGSSRKKTRKNRKRRIQKAIAVAEARLQVQGNVAECRRQLLTGATFSAQVGTSLGRGEQPQFQVAPQTEPAPSDQPLRQTKPRGKRAGKLVAKQNTTKNGSLPDITTSQTRDSYAAAFKANELCVAVMNEPFNELTAEQANAIKTCLENKLIDDMLNPSTAAHMAHVGFRGKAHFSEGVLKMWCEDDVALLWLRCALETIRSPIAGSKLVVRPQGEVERRILCGLLVPELTMDLNTIRQILTVHNSKTVNVGSWTLVKAEKQVNTETPGFYLRLRIPESDVVNLKKQERRVKWLFGNIYIRILGEESRTCTAPAPTPALPEPTKEEPVRIDTVSPEAVKVEIDVEE